MNDIHKSLCSVCTKVISPKKKLKCKNKKCNIVCHIKCDQVILNSSNAMTVESYYCENCCKGGDSIVYKKEHDTRSRSKSTSLAHIPESGKNNLATPRDESPKELTQPIDKSSDETTPMMNINIPLRSEEDKETNNQINTNNQCLVGSPVSSDNETAEGKADENTQILNGTITESPSKDENKAPIINVPTDDPPQEQDKTTASNIPLDDHQLDRCSQLADKVKSQEQYIDVLLCEIKEKNQQLKDKDKTIMNKNCKIAELEEAKDHCVKTLGLRNEQIRLLSENSAVQVEEKLELKAKLYIKNNYCKNIENQYFQLKETIGSDGEDDNVQQDLADENKELTESLNQLELKNVGLSDKIAALETEIANLRNQASIKDDVRSQHNEKRELERIIERMESKFNKIDSILHETEPNQSPYRNEGFSLISDTPLMSEGSTVNSPYNTPSSRESRSRDSPPPHHSHGRGSRSREKSPHHQPPGRKPGSRESPSHGHTPDTAPRSRENPSHRPSQRRVPRGTESPYHRLGRESSSRENQIHHHHSSRRESSYRDCLLSNNKNNNNQSTDHKNYNPDKEKEDIQRKKNNIIILGLPETTTNKESLEEVIHINRHILGNRYFDKRDVRHIGRVGEPSNDRPRPLKIELMDTICKIDIMRYAYHLKDHPTYGNISIMHDLTPHQLKELNRLKQLAKVQEQEDPDHNYRIRGKPGQWTIEKFSKN